MVDPTSAIVAVALLALPAIPTKTKNYIVDPYVSGRNARPDTTPIQIEGIELLSNPTTYIDVIGASMGRAEPLTHLAAELDSYAQLEEGWDGEDALRPDNGSISTARKLLDWLPGGAPLPKPMISANGEIGYYWHSDIAFIDAVMKSNGTFSLFSRVDGDAPKEFFYDDLTPGEASTRLLSELLHPLRRV